MSRNISASRRSSVPISSTTPRKSGLGTQQQPVLSAPYAAPGGISKTPKVSLSAAATPAKKKKLTTATTPTALGTTTPLRSTATKRPTKSPAATARSASGFGLHPAAATTTLSAPQTTENFHALKSSESRGATASQLPPPAGSFAPRHSTSFQSVMTSTAGERYEPNEYKLGFSFQGRYACMETTQKSAALWAGNGESGTIDIYSYVTGELVLTLPPRSDSGIALGAQKAGSSLRGSQTTLPPSLRPRTTTVMKPTAMKATSTHMWVGYDNGNVAIYDHLVLTCVTEGRFHSKPVLCFSILGDGTVVSSAEDGSLVHWDREESNFEAITRTKADLVSLEGRLTCATAVAHGPQVLCGFESGSIAALEVGTGSSLFIMRGHSNRVNAVVVFGEIIFSAAEDGAVCVWSSSPDTSIGRQGSGKMLKRIIVSPCVRGLLPDYLTSSLWVAYADGLLERWSANPDDDFGIEEVIREGLLPPEEVEQGSGPLEIMGLLSMGSVETLQVLSLSSNGVNKVWYGHRNVLEENISNSINAINDVIGEDARDTAVWRERMNVLRQKETERKQKYVLILEQLSEQKLLLRYLERWRRSVVKDSIAKSNATVMVYDMANRARFALVRRYFSKWASFYDNQQRYLRRYLLAQSLAEASKRTHIATMFHRWQVSIIRMRMRQANEQCVKVMERASYARIIGPMFHRWQHFARSKGARQQGRPNTAQLQLLESKAMRQTLSRSLKQWTAVSQQRRATTEGRSRTAWDRYMETLAGIHEGKRVREAFQRWRQWFDRRRRFASLSAVAELRSQQVTLHQQYYFYMAWLRFVRGRKLAKHAAELKEVEAKLRVAESEHGGDIFEKLQLQKRIDQLIEQQENEERLLKNDEAQLQQLQQNCNNMRHQQLQLTPSGATNHTIQALPTSNPIGTGPMATRAPYYHSLIDQQRLSPSVLGHMPLSEASAHVMSQLKGNVLNMYTDMPLFKQVKDRRRAGAGAQSIFHESFAEVKRLIVSTLKGQVRSGGRSRWPLCMEALDCIPSHHCANVLNAIKTMVVTYDLITSEDLLQMESTTQEVVANADWIFLIARACYMRRKPLLPVNNRS